MARRPTIEFGFDNTNVRFDRDVPAFEEKLVRSPFDKITNAHPSINYAKLHEFEGDKRFIIRKGDETYAEGELTVGETCRLVKGLFDELNQVYSIPVPVQFVIAKDPANKTVFYILTQTISTTEFEELEGEEKSRAAAGIKKVFETVLTYLEDKSRTGGNFLTDLVDTDQYVYGTLSGDAHPRWYLVDTDPYYSRSEDSLWEILDMWPDALEWAEESFSIDLQTLKEKGAALKERLFGSDEE